MKIRLEMPWAAAVAICLLACMAAATAADMEAKPSNAAQRVEYEQLKLAELVRRANANDVRAQFELGSRFNYGRAAPKNVKEALRWLRRAAQGGQADAQRLLAIKFYNGYDVAVDHDEALLWSKRLAESGDAPGQMMLASMYANGEGGPRNLVRSYMWYDIAATSAQKATDDSALFAAASEMRDKTAALLLPAEEAEAQQLASDWWLRKQGVSLAPKPIKRTVPKKPATAKPKATSKPAAPAKPAVKQP